MARSKIGVVCYACECWSEGNLAPLYDLYTPDVTADPGRLWFENAGLVEGVDAVVKGFAAIVGAFERNELFPESALEVGDTVVVPLLWCGLPPGSSTFVEQRLIGVFNFRDERIASMTWFPALEEALDELGLERSLADQMVPIERPTQAKETS